MQICIDLNRGDCQINLVPTNRMIAKFSDTQRTHQSPDGQLAKLLILRISFSCNGLLLSYAPDTIGVFEDI